MRGILTLALMSTLGLATGCSGNDTEPVEAQGHRLIVLPDGASVDTLAKIRGSLQLNDQGCFTLGDLLLVVEPGARVLADGDGIQLPGGMKAQVGGSLHGSGGQATPRARAKWQLEHYHLEDEAEPCWGSDTTGAVMLDADEGAS